MKCLIPLISVLSIAFFVLTEGTCGPACQETAKEHRIQYLVNHMYHSITDAPIPGSPSATPTLNPAMRQVYVERQDFIEENKPELNSPNLESKFLSAEDPSGGEDRSTLVAYFPLSEDLDKYEIIGGTLLIATDLPAHHHKALNVQVFEKNADQTLGEMVATKTLRANKGGRIYFDLPVSALNRWYTSNPIGGLFVSAIHDGKNVAIHPQQEAQDAADKMLLQVFLRNKNFDGIIRVQPNSTVSRSKRAAAKHICTKQTSNTGCCLFELVVDFSKIGWGWVITPTLYNAYMCRGDCQKNSIHIYHDLTHSKVMRSVNGVIHVPDVNMENLGYCCHPTEYDYLNMMYVNQFGDVMTSTIHGMIASRCGCA